MFSVPQCQLLQLCNPFTRARNAHGNKFLNEYSILERKGEGAFGWVQVVKHKNTSEYRACKIIPAVSQGNDDPAETAKLVNREIQFLRDLNHPGIVNLNETFVDESYWYLVMEYCHGGSLADRLRYLQDEEIIRQYTREMLSAIAHCHANGVIHRDLKPENILFTTESLRSPVRIVDFGLSDTYDSIYRNAVQVIRPTIRTFPGMGRVFGGAIQTEGLQIQHMMQAAGTAHYMAPEMFDGKYSFNVDVWSIGTMLYLMLTQTHPFFTPGWDTQDTVREKVKNVNLPSYEPFHFRHVSSGATHCTKSLLQRNPNLRPEASASLELPWLASDRRGTNSYTNITEPAKTTRPTVSTSFAARHRSCPRPLYDTMRYVPDRAGLYGYIGPTALVQQGTITNGQPRQQTVVRRPRSILTL